MRCNALFVCALLCCALSVHARDHFPDHDVDVLWQDFSAMERQARTNRADADDYVALMTTAVRLQAEYEAGLRTLTGLEAERLRQVLNTPLDVDAPPPVIEGTMGTFEGVVLEQGSGNPVTAGFVRAVRWNNPFIPYDAPIQPDGSYSLSVEPGHYLLHTIGTPEHIRFTWPDKPCANPATCSPWYGGEVIEIGAGDVDTRNFLIERGVRVQGTVTDDQGNPIESAMVTVRTRTGYGATVATNASGEYSTSQAFPPGHFRVFATPPAGGSLLAALHDGQPCTEECSTLPVSYLELDDVVGATTVDLELAEGFGLSGSVDSGGQPQEGVTIRLYSDDGHTQVWVSTDAAGEYEFPALRPADYRIVALSPETLNQVYPDLDCFGNACAPEAGSPVALGDAPVTRDFSLAPGASISGQITRASDGAPAVNTRVGVTNIAQGAHWAWTDANGEYTVSGLVEGTFYVMAFPDIADGDHRQTYLGNVACPATSCGELGQPLSIPATGNVGNVDIELVDGGGLSGQIIDAETGLPLSTMTGARLELWVASGPYQGQLAAQPMVQMDGTYSGDGLVPGAYKAVFGTTTHLGLIDTAFGGQPCPRGACDLDALPTVFVTAGTVLSGIDGTLPRGPVISGRITDSNTGEPPPPLPAGMTTSRLMAFYGTSGNYASFSDIDGEGNFRSRTGFPAGSFFASTFLSRNMMPFGGNYIDQAYDGLDCPRLKCNLTASASAINVAGSDIDGIDFSLRQGGGISGVVTDDDGGAPLAGVAIEAYDGAGRLVAETASNVLGQYTVDALPTGNYTVRTRNRQGYQNQIHDGGSCTPFCDPQSGTPIAVSEGSVTSGIDFALVRSVAISGTVRVDGVPAGNITVEAYGAIGNLVSETLSQPDGSYAFTNLSPGQFYLRTRNAFGHADALYAGHPCVGDACRVRDGDAVTLQPGQSLSGVNLDLAAGAVISGEVHDRLDPSTTLSGVTVQLLDDRGAVAFETTTGSNGAFGFGALAAGDYHLVTRNTPAYVDQTLGGTPCPSACNGLNGDVVTVVAGGNSSGNDLDLAPGAAISGNVQASGSPAVGAQAQVYNDTGVPVAQQPTNASGNYEIDNLPDGDFFVRIGGVPGHVSALWDAIACSGYCDILSGDAVSVVGSTPVGSINFNLAAGGGIAGTVTGGGNALPGVEVVAFDNAGFIAGTAVTNAAGQYSIGGLVDGSYRLRSTNIAGFVDRVFGGDTCSPSPCPLAGGTAIEVSGATISGIDFALQAGGSISGTATDTFGNPLPTGSAVLMDADGIELLDSPIVDGLWSFNGVADGTYYLLIENDLALVDELFDGVPCPAGACDITGLGTPIVLGGGSLMVHARGVSGISFQLSGGATIAGRVSDADTQAPLVGVEVFFFDAAGNRVGRAVTDGLGDYASQGGLPPGDYYAATVSGTARGVGDNYINQLYDGTPCLLNCDVTAGTVISLDGSGATGIDFALGQGGGLRGRVSGPDDEHLVQTVVRVYDADGFLAGTAATNSQGRYQIDGLPAGEYFAHTANLVGLTDVSYGDQPCQGACTPLDGDPITVPASGFVEDIDFQLTTEDEIFADRFEQL
jgi:hypothetical protein